MTLLKCRDVASSETRRTTETASHLGRKDIDAMNDVKRG
jgi:hypothetical protein